MNSLRTSTARWLRGLAEVLDPAPPMEWSDPKTPPAGFVTVDQPSGRERINLAPLVVRCSPKHCDPDKVRVEVYRALHRAAALQ